MSSQYSEKAPMVSVNIDYQAPPYSDPQPTAQPTTQSTGSKIQKYFSNIGNPFPKSLGKSCLRAAKVLESYLEHSQEQAIVTQKSLESCSGLLILSSIKGAYIWSGRIGSGLVVARNPDGSWSLPWAVNLLGVGYGFQAGLELTDMVIVLKSQESLNALKQKGNISLGGNLTLAVGPFGRSAELDIPVTCAVMYSLSKSQGLFFGISLELSLWLQNGLANNKFYGGRVTLDDILSGKVNTPPEALILLNALQKRFPPLYSTIPTYTESNASTSQSNYYQNGYQNSDQKPLVSNEKTGL